ncbi:MAG: hypothetical protein ABIZ64_14955 [Casimicrobium sp.]
MARLDGPEAAAIGAPAPRAESLILVASFSRGVKSLSGTYGAASVAPLKTATQSVATSALH